jgi:hypothetical protein
MTCRYLLLFDERRLSDTHRGSPYSSPQPGFQLRLSREFSAIVTFFKRLRRLLFKKHGIDELNVHPLKLHLSLLYDPRLGS